MLSLNDALPSYDRSGWLVNKLAAKIFGAKREALLVSPYFVPGETLTARLVDLAQREDVAVGVVTNSLAANDVPAVHAGYASYRGQLLDGGVELYELRAQGAGETHGLFGSSGASRSEEHTSELQSLMRISYAVFCL